MLSCGFVLRDLLNCICLFNAINHEEQNHLITSSINIRYKYFQWLKWKVRGEELYPSFGPKTGGWGGAEHFYETVYSPHYIELFWTVA